MQAKPSNMIPVLRYAFVEGVYVCHVDCRDYDHYRQLPGAIHFQGRVFGKTGWNSDTNYACYQTNCQLAIPIL